MTPKQKTHIKNLMKEAKKIGLMFFNRPFLGPKSSAYDKHSADVAYDIKEGKSKGHGHKRKPKRPEWKGLKRD